MHQSRYGSSLGSKVSVVIPHFNSSETLRRALESVENQTFAVFEILVVDDCSSPREKEMAREIVDSFSQARIIEQPSNCGPGSARNVGWDAACGDWIAFLDSDDAWHPRKLELQLQLAMSVPEEPTLVSSRTIILDTVQDFPRLDADTQISHLNITKWQLFKSNTISTPTVLVKTSLELRFTEGRKYSEDFELWLSIATSGLNIVLVDLPLVALFKAKYGDSGLSANLLSMAVGELRTYLLLYRSRRISVVELFAVLTWSTLKSLRRLTIVGASRILRRFG